MLSIIYYSSFVALTLADVKKVNFLGGLQRYLTRPSLIRVAKNAVLWAVLQNYRFCFYVPVSARPVARYTVCLTVGVRSPLCTQRLLQSFRVRVSLSFITEQQI